jgi:hypothetical protein
MKGYTATSFGEPTDEGVYSEIQVLKSKAGYYIGTIFKHKEGWEEPGSMESGYYPTKELAELDLNNNTWNQRQYS